MTAALGVHVVVIEGLSDPAGAHTSLLTTAEGWADGAARWPTVPGTGFTGYRYVCPAPPGVPPVAFYDMRRKAQRDSFLSLLSLPS